MIRPLGNTDNALAQRVRAALAALLVPVLNIRIDVSCGVVTLTGEVPSWSQRYDAEQASARLAGVVKVVNRIVVAPSTTVDLQPARVAVALALRKEAILEASHIALCLIGGVVHVRGFVESEREKEVVLSAVRATGGIGAVVDELVMKTGEARLEGGGEPPGYDSLPAPVTRR
jgi:osmotically-inducible protein OsmY